MQLLNFGANPLIEDKAGFNVFHRSALFSPTLLVQLLGGIEARQIPHPNALGVRSIIRRRWVGMGKMALTDLANAPKGFH